MEVRQQDGQYLPATILKLTDNSTYTVGKLLHGQSTMAVVCV